MTGSAGLCAALEEAQQRVGTDPNEDSDAPSLSTASGTRERRAKGGGLFDSILDAAGDDSDTDSATGKSDIPVRYYAMLCYALLCYAMLCYAMLCYVMLCYAMLCSILLCSILSCPLHNMSSPSQVNQFALD